MKVTRKNLLYSTFIGLGVEIINSSQRNLVGLKGVAADETKNLIIIDAEGKNVKVPKVSSVFRFYVSDGTMDIDGRKITFRHYERPKKVKKDAVLR